MVWMVKGRKESLWRETGSRISSMTSGMEMNLSARPWSFSPDSMTALASTTATEMALGESLVSTNTRSVCCCGGGGGCFLTTLLQHDAVAGTEDGVSSMLCRERERERRAQHNRRGLVCLDR